MHATQAYLGIEVKHHSFLISEIDMGDHLTSDDRTYRYQLNRKLGVLQSRSDVLSLPRNEPRFISTPSHYTNHAIPAPNKQENGRKISIYTNM